MTIKYAFSQEDKDTMIKLYLEGKSSVEIAKIYGISNPSSVIGYVRRAGIKSRSNSINSRKYNVDHNFFTNIDNEEKAYWLGFMYADGFVLSDRNAIGLTLAIADLEHLTKFNSSLKSDYKINTYTSNGGYNAQTEYCRLIIYSELLKKDLIKHGCVEQKTDILKAPNILKELAPHFIRGYFDGDGCITSSYNKYGAKDWKIKICGTPELLDYITDFIHENNIANINKYYIRKPEQIVRSIDFGGNNQVEKFVTLLYENAHIYLDRKKDKIVDFILYLVERDRNITC